jgi:hypothetical protein
MTTSSTNVIDFDDQANCVRMKNTKLDESVKVMLVPSSDTSASQIETKGVLGMPDGENIQFTVLDPMDDDAPIVWYHEELLKRIADAPAMKEASRLQARHSVPSR